VRDDHPAGQISKIQNFGLLRSFRDRYLRQRESIAGSFSRNPAAILRLKLASAFGVHRRLLFFSAPLRESLIV
jgi:hypothetical protein